MKDPGLSGTESVTFAQGLKGAEHHKTLIPSNLE